MTATNEGRAALEAAVNVYEQCTSVPCITSGLRAALSAYLDALSGWRLVRTEDLRGTCCPTGLEDRGNGDIRDCSVCGGDGISPAYKLTPPGLEKEQEHD